MVGRSSNFEKFDEWHFKMSHYWNEFFEKVLSEHKPEKPATAAYDPSI